MQHELALLIEKKDVNNVITKMNGIRVNYIIAPIELKENKQFLQEALSYICIQGNYCGQILYYE